MLLNRLDKIPEAPLPPPFRLRLYRAGDRDVWVKLYGESEQLGTSITPELFDREFRGEDLELSRRMLFLEDETGRAIGTSTAWCDDFADPAAIGRVHWVAIHPEFQGRKLARPLLTATLQCLRSCGHTQAYLFTHTLRIPAVTLYLTYGFVPDIRSEEQRAGWTELLPLLREDCRPPVAEALR